MRKLWKVAAVLFVAGATFASYQVVSVSRGVRVEVENVGTTPITGIVVEVTGASYDIGRLEPGSSETVGVSPTSESHVEVTWVDSDGRECRGTIDCYFEAQGRYHGRLEIRIDGPNVRGTTSDLKMGFLQGSAGSERRGDSPSHGPPVGRAWAESSSREPVLGLGRRGIQGTCSAAGASWRRRKDSNPRCLAARRFSKPLHSAALPRLRLCHQRVRRAWERG